MVMSVQTNVMSLNAQKNLYQTQNRLESSMSRLSSGYRITKAGDDAAGLGVSANLVAQIRSYGQAARNAADGVSLVQTAEGGTAEVSNILTRMRELAMQSASDGIRDTERGYVQTEAAALILEIDRIAQTAEYNGVMLLDGSAATLDFQVGIRATANDIISFTTADMTTATLGVDAVDLSTKAGATTALAALDTAIEGVSNVRAGFGAVGNRLQSVTATINTAAENVSAANSRIKDVDVAEETSSLTRASVMMQAGISVLAQANQQPQMALKLLG
ncbi:MAG: flagellin FliC [Deltaproteobacteria bacterium]|nr:flagellin FliC [Deltaproteobacteria bacterium]